MNRWDERYRKHGEGDMEPAALLLKAIEGESAGRALDIACGTGRNALLLARCGWRVTAVDYSNVAIEMLASHGEKIEALVRDLEAGEYPIEPAAFDLICDFHYLQRDLFDAIRAGVRLGGLFVGSIHLAGAQMNPLYLLHPGELQSLFSDWKIVHYSEADEAEIIARKPE
jgi:tellurite methyltransferase